MVTGIAFFVILTYTPTYMQREAGRNKRKEWIFFFQIYFTTLVMPEDWALRIFKDILHKFQRQKY